MKKAALGRQAKISSWLVGGSLAGGAGAMVTGTEDHPLRHVLPEALPSFVTSPSHKQP